MLIKVTKTTKASLDNTGRFNKIYESNEVYDIYNELAQVFINNNWGEEVGTEKKAKKKKEIENKAIENIENKSPFKKKNN